MTLWQLIDCSLAPPRKLCLRQESRRRRASGVIECEVQHNMQNRLLILLTLACTILCASTLRAQSLSLTPATIDAKVRRGGVYSHTFTLTNSTNTRLRVHCAVRDYWYDANNKRLTGRPGTLPRSASSWVQFSSSELIVEPNSSANIKAIVSIPQDAAGGYYTSPTFEAEAAEVLQLAPQSGNGSQANIKIRFQGLMLLTTEDATEYNVEIMDGRISPPTASSSLQMNLDVRNRSTTHARIQGVFAVLDASGKLAGLGKIEEKRYMPGQRDTVKAAWSGALAPGHYTAVVTLSYNRVGMTPATLVYQVPFDAGPSSALARQ